MMERDEEGPPRRGDQAVAQAPLHHAHVARHQPAILFFLWAA
jgi:hypothetical protein